MPGLTALIPLDGSDLSEHALELLPFIKLLGFEKVRLVSVWEGHGEHHAVLPGRREDELREIGEKGRGLVAAYLKGHVERVESAGLEAQTEVRSGRAADEVLAASEADTDLVLIATHGRSGVARWRLGSVADKIIRDENCPTLVIGPNVREELKPYVLKRILVPVDGSPLAEEALPLAGWIAGRVNAEIDLVRTVSLTSVAYDPSLGIYPVDLVEALEDAAKDYLTQAAARFTGRQVSTALRIGSPSEQLLQHMEERPAGLVVMASHGRAGVLRAALGSVADRVLHGPAPVLILRPGDEAGSRLLAQAATP
jgi:nucleotide-binding universal stress UspA family protein